MRIADAAAFCAAVGITSVRTPCRTRGRRRRRASGGRKSVQTKSAQISTLSCISGMRTWFLRIERAVSSSVFSRFFGSAFSSSQSLSCGGLRSVLLLVVNVEEQDAKMPLLFLKMKKLKLIMMMSYSQSKRKIEHEI